MGNDRVIILVDMDCFYCQVEEKLNPNITGKPIAVVQYNAWRGGGIIAVNYPARDRGVTRHMRGNEAKEKCPDINLVKVPNVRGKADLTKYREAGKRVAEVLQTFTPLLERASVDEAYMDVTKAVENRIDNMIVDLTPDLFNNTFVVGSNIKDFLHNVYSNISMCEKDLKLAVGAFIAEQIRAAVYEKTGYRCSAGIAHNKILAKLACGLNKPNKQTILSESGIPELYENLPIKKITSLGGKFGIEISQKLQINTMGELSKFSEKKLLTYFDEKTSKWLYNIAKGIDLEPVITRLVSKSIGCCKKFPGVTALKSEENVLHWLKELALELAERLEKDLQENNRKAKQMVVSFAQEINRKDVSSTRTTILNSYEATKITQDAFEIIKKHCGNSHGGFHLKFLGLSAGSFDDCKNVREITSFFKTCNSKSTPNCSASNENFSDKENKNSTAIQENEDVDEEDSSTDEEIIDKTETLQNSTESDTIDFEGHSVFSASTLEMDENSDELVFYPDEYRLKSDTTSDNGEDNSDTKNFTTDIKDNSPSPKNDDDETDDSIGNELFLEKQENTEQQQTRSFFVRYLENKKCETENKSPVERNFDTSMNLQEVSDNDSSVNDSSGEAKCNEDETINLSDESMSTPLSVTETQICNECIKAIPIDEILSHNDYHYALKLVNEETKMQKENTKLINSSKMVKTTGKKSTKRKRSSTDKMPTLTSFFLNKVSEDTFEDGSYELCNECNKRIKIEEYSSHMDYHTAKKLHIEINQNTSQTVNKKNLKSKLKTVASFFKPV